MVEMVDGCRHLSMAHATRTSPTARNVQIQLAIPVFATCTEEVSDPMTMGMGKAIQHPSRRQLQTPLMIIIASGAEQ
jgi:hypothetical protein